MKQIFTSIAPQSSTILQSFEKGKRAQIGETRIWSGEKYQRNETGWKYVGKATGRDKSVEELPFAKQRGEVWPFSKNPAIDELVADAKKNGIDNLSMKSIFAFEQLSVPQRMECLQKLKFTGLVYRPSFYSEDYPMWDVREPWEKKNLLGQIDDLVFYNDPEGDSADSSYDLYYEDGSVLDTRDIVERTKVKRQGLRAIIGWGLAGGVYWAADKEWEQKAMEASDMEKWENGFVQD